MSRVLFVVCMVGSLLLAMSRFSPGEAVEVTPLAPPATSASESYEQHTPPGWGTQAPSSLAAPTNSGLYRQPLVSHGQLVSKEVWDKFSKRPGAFGRGRGTDPAAMYDASKGRVVTPRPQQAAYSASPAGYRSSSGTATGTADTAGPATYAAPRQSPPAGRVVLPKPAAKSKASAPATAPRTTVEKTPTTPAATSAATSAPVPALVPVAVPVAVPAEPPAPANAPKTSQEKATPSSSEKAAPPPHAPASPAAPLAPASPAAPAPSPAASTPPAAGQQQAPANISASWIIHPRPSLSGDAKASAPLHSPAPSYLPPETAAKIAGEPARPAGSGSASPGQAASGQAATGKAQP